MCRAFTDALPCDLLFLSESPLVLCGIIPTSWLQANMAKILLERPDGGYGWSDQLGLSLTVPELRGLLILSYQVSRANKTELSFKSVIVQELKIELDLPWMDALRIEFALGYKVELTPRRIPRNMVRMSPLDSYHGEYFIRKWLEDTRTS